jgi:hypothetical protein
VKGSSTKLNGAAIMDFDRYNDPEFVGKLKAGDDGATRECFAFMASCVCRVLKSKYAQMTPFELEQATAEGIEQAILKIEQFRQGRAKFTTWVVRICLNRAHDIVTRRKSIQAVVSLDEPGAKEAKAQSQEQALLRAGTRPMSRQPFRECRGSWTSYRPGNKRCFNSSPTVTPTRRSRSRWSFPTATSGASSRAPLGE